MVCALFKRAPVVIGVYDIQGQKIATLFQDVAGAGSYVMYWDGQDDKGEPVSSGVYLYALRGEGISLVRKMVLLR
ncbi:MAG: hypothetical protein D6681_00355 [Calditrichaeota bacterium]|nr:MAG: hypothetical protein D6681_00355 [Calditrichota bacterium]